MKKSKVTYLIFSISSLVFSQVGIGTKIPQSSLDVNGNIMLREELKVGGTKTVDGSSGSYNDILVSQGDGNTPLWKSSKVGFYEEGEYRTTSSFITTSERGLVYSSSQNDDITTSLLGELLVTSPSIWKELPNLSTKFSVDDPKNKINIMFQTGIESGNIGSTSNQNIKFMCGIFIDNILVALRADQIDGIRYKNSNNQSIYTLNYTVNDVTTGEHTLKVGCRRISSTSGTNVSLAIGQGLDNSVANSFMLQSVLKFDVSELIKITR